MRLHGRDWSREALQARTGCLQQAFGVRRMRCEEGPEAGSDIIEVRTGAGLSFDVLPGRGLDIGRCELRGVPLAWLAPGGPQRSLDGPAGTGFLRSCAGGLLMTCGLGHVGPADAEHGLHGRIHHIPARQVVAEGRWHGDEYDLRIAGVVDEVAMFGQRLQLTREITCRAATNRIRVADTVENMGGRSAELMVLYHCNLGWPLLAPEARIRLPGSGPRPREAGAGTIGWDAWGDPDPTCDERVFFHDPLPSGMVEAEVVNPLLGVRLSLRWDAALLPHLVQWHMQGHGEHVLGIEPATCSVHGHATERRNGRIIDLQPGAIWSAWLEFDAS